MRPSSAPLLLLGLCSLAGCASAGAFYDRIVGVQPPQQVTGSQFTHAPAESRPPAPTGDSSVGPDRRLTPEQPALPPTQAPLTSLPPTVTPPTVTPPTVTPPTVTSAATTEPGVAVAPPATEPTLASGQYLTLGAVVAQVNGTPIYANKVLQLVWPSLHNDAHTMGREQFARSATDHVITAIRTQEDDELVFAAAERSLEETDKRLAADLAAGYRQQLITESGGSIELARRKATANGDNFDEKIHDKYREYMIDVYRQRKFSNQLEPSAQEMRQSYQANVETFTQHSKAEFDLLKIDPALIPGDNVEKNRQTAFDLAKKAHDLLAAGTPFPKVFSDFNNDPGLKSITNNTGSMGSIERGSFNIAPVEEALWKLQPGQFSDPIEYNGALFITKMETRQEGSVRSFDDQTVQTAITAAIKKARFSKLADAENERLRSESIIQEDQPAMQTCIDMAMQSYDQWSVAK